MSDRCVRAGINPPSPSKSCVPDIPPRQVSKAPNGHTKLYYQGFAYTKANASGVKITYRCSSYRKGCRAQFAFMAATMSYDFTGMALHTCRTNTMHRDVTTDDTGHCIDASNSIMKEVDKLVVDTNTTQGVIWLAIVDKFYMQSGPPVRGVSKHAVENRVKYIRGKQLGGNRNRTIENPPLSKVKGSVQGFFQFQFSWHDDIKSQKDTTGIDRVVGWAHPELRNLLRFENLSWFMDGTFRCAPEGFKQCVSIMIYDPSSELYIPAVFTPITAMTNESYLKLLRCVEACVGCRLTPKEVVCEFEGALIGAIRDFFPDIRIIDCLFHFKQACRRKMKSYRIPKEEAKLAMAPNVVDVLTVIESSKIAVQGIAWVKKKIQELCECKGVGYSRDKW
ncbi:Hypothetical protein PHPALM_9546 [Phytophthora palmivora]|uniref:MULE transposase domain-containing protein n=1 Tax=Phytophthora palmivora TaxID=4796 RepID=A0A2P4Y710_9STRA|nr:Hypothetical protein PHPALM_9546 [Phytophthora palmivora]